MKKKRKVLTCLAAGFLTAAVGAAWYLENNDLGTTQLFYQDDKLPVAFDGFRIVQVADLHDKRFGPRQERLLSGGARVVSLPLHLFKVRSRSRRFIS